MASEILWISLVVTIIFPTFPLKKKRFLYLAGVESRGFYLHLNQIKSIMVGSINSLCQILELFSCSNCKLKRGCSELHERFNRRTNEWRAELARTIPSEEEEDNVNLRFEPKRTQKMAKRQPTIKTTFDGGNL